MTLLEWLDAREPAPEPALRARIRTFASPLQREEGTLPDRLLVAAERALTQLLANGTGARDFALDLLAIDALVTYAFEAATESADRIPELAHEAMARLSAVARPA